MTDISTYYMGLQLKSPIVVSSSGLTNDIKTLIEIEKNGAGAVVLRSLFEEEILNRIDSLAESTRGVAYGREAGDYLKVFTRQESLDKYVALIEEAKSKLTIPVIASINCLTAVEWISFASAIEAAGADAIEINIFRLPSDPEITGESMEKLYFEVARKIKEQVNIPVAFKLGFYFSSLGRMLVKLSESGIDALVLFNRFVNFDIDIENLKLKPGNIYSDSHEISHALRWTGIVSGNIKSDIAISTGVHDYSGIVKGVLAGASACYAVSALYMHGIGHIAVMNDELKGWMKKHNFKSIDDFKGRLSMKKMTDAVLYERTQFLHYFTAHK